MKLKQAVREGLKAATGQAVELKPRDMTPYERQKAALAKHASVQFTFGPTLMDIICGRCNKGADASLWCRDRFGNERPLNHFQCPNCNFAFKVVKTPVGQANRIEPIQATL